MSENSIVGYILKNFTATDGDSTNSNNQLTFSLSTQETDFMINSSGQLSVSKMLDTSRKSMYEMTIIATDNGSPALKGLAVIVINIIDVNNHAPVFLSSCNNTISEHSPVGMLVLSCPATDKDTAASLSYQINGSSMFAVDNKGTVMLKQPLDGKAFIYNLTLIVTDGVHTATTGVTIRVTPLVICRPLFNQSLYIGYVQENSQITTSVITALASDAKNNSLTYTLQAGVTAFRVTSSGKNISLPSLSVSKTRLICR